MNTSLLLMAISKNSFFADSEFEHDYEVVKNAIKPRLLRRLIQSPFCLICVQLVWLIALVLVAHRPACMTERVLSNKDLYYLGCEVKFIHAAQSAMLLIHLKLQRVLLSNTNNSTSTSTGTEKACSPSLQSLLSMKRGIHCYKIYSLTTCQPC